MCHLPFSNDFVLFPQEFAVLESAMKACLEGERVSGAVLRASVASGSFSLRKAVKEVRLDVNDMRSSTSIEMAELSK